MYQSTVRFVGRGPPNVHIDPPVAVWTVEGCDPPAHIRTPDVEVPLVTGNATWAGGASPPAASDWPLLLPKWRSP